MMKRTEKVTAQWKSTLEIGRNTVDTEKSRICDGEQRFGELPEEEKLQN